VAIVFVSDERLLEMNKKYLKHDYYTDILTFPKDTYGVSGELYISIDRVKENAILEEVELKDEVHRVMAHGLLHLLGYNDKSDEEKMKMRDREVFYLNLRTF
jgi:rRNA maturation RNase YbeY